MALAHQAAHDLGGGVHLRLQVDACCSRRGGRPPFSCENRPGGSRCTRRVRAPTPAGTRAPPAGPEKNSLAPSKWPEPRARQSARRRSTIAPASRGGRARRKLDEVVARSRQEAAEGLLLVGRVDGDGADGLLAQRRGTQRAGPEHQKRGGTQGDGICQTTGVRPGPDRDKPDNMEPLQRPDHGTTGSEGNHKVACESARVLPRPAADRTRSNIETFPSAEVPACNPCPACLISLPLAWWPCLQLASPMAPPGRAGAQAMAPAPAPAPAPAACRGRAAGGTVDDRRASVPDYLDPKDPLPRRTAACSSEVRRLLDQAGNYQDLIARHGNYLASHPVWRSKVEGSCDETRQRQIQPGAGPEAHRPWWARSGGREGRPAGSHQLGRGAPAPPATSHLGREPPRRPRYRPGEPAHRFRPASCRPRPGLRPPVWRGRARGRRVRARPPVPCRRPAGDRHAHARAAAAPARRR